jgi:hypothetical protein
MKMMLSYYIHINSETSLVVVAIILIGGIVVSIVSTRRGTGSGLHHAA